MVLLAEILLLCVLICFFIRNIEILPFDKKNTIPLRGVLALGIVLYHIAMYSMDEKLIPFRTLGAPIVSIFFFMMGYGSCASVLSKGNTYFHGYISNKLRYIVLPFAIASIFELLLILIGEGNFQFFWKPLDMEDFSFITFHTFLSNLLFLPSQILPFSWYVVVAFWGYIAFYICFRKSKNIRKSVHLYGLLCLLYIVFVFNLNGSFVWVSTHSIYIGCLAGLYNEEIKNFYLHKRKVLYVSIVVLLCIITLNKCWWRTGITIDQSWFYFCFSPFWGIITMIVIQYWMGGVKGRLLSWLGNYSYEIYLVQGIALFPILKYLNRTNIWLTSTVIILLTILLAFLLKKVTILLLNMRKSN